MLAAPLLPEEIHRIQQLATMITERNVVNTRQATLLSKQEDKRREIRTLQTRETPPIMRCSPQLKLIEDQMIHKAVLQQLRHDSQLHVYKIALSVYFSEPRSQVRQHFWAAVFSQKQT